MKLPRFEYRRAESVEEAVEALAEAGAEAKLLAGGQSLLAAMAFRLIRPALLVDIDRLPGLAAIEVGPDGLRVGALTRHVVLEHSTLGGAWSALQQAAAHIGHLPIRVRGTLGGSIAHGDPAAELAVVAIALEAEIVARSPEAERRLPASEFFLGPYTTALEPAEMVVELRFPPHAAGVAAVFDEFAERPGDFALASVCTVVGKTDGRVATARIALGSVGATPLRAREAELLLQGSAGDAEAVTVAAETAARECDPASDSHASAEYRRELVAVLVKGALTRALAEAG